MHGARALTDPIIRGFPRDLYVVHEAHLWPDSFKNRTRTDDLHQLASVNRQDSRFSRPVSRESVRYYMLHAYRRCLPIGMLGISRRCIPEPPAMAPPPCASDASARPATTETRSAEAGETSAPGGRGRLIDERQISFTLVCFWLSGHHSASRT